MAWRIKQCWQGWGLLAQVSRPSMVLLSIAIILSSLGARVEASSGESSVTQSVPGKLAQQQGGSVSDRDRAAAQRAFQEGEQLRNQGTPESLRQAIERFAEALQVFKAVGDRQWEAATLNQMGLVYSSLGEHKQALDYFNQELLIWQVLGNQRWQAVALNGIGQAYLSLGEQLGNQRTQQSLRQAIEKYAEALQVFRTVGDRQWEAATLNRMGLVYSSLSEHKQALNCFNQELLIWQALGNQSWQAIALDGIAKTYLSLGEKQQALNYYNQALRFYRALENREGEAITLIELASIHQSLDDKQKALDLYNQALLLYRDVGNKLREAMMFISIGQTYLSLGEEEKGIENWNQAVLLFRSLRRRSLEGNMLVNIGAIYNSSGKKQKALDYFNQALPPLRAAKDRVREAETLRAIGLCYIGLGQLQQAMEYLGQALVTWQASGNSSGEAMTLLDIAKLERNLGHFTEALAQIKASVKIIETQRSEWINPDERDTYSGATWKYYNFYIDLLMQLHQQHPDGGYNLTAFEVSESARARTLLELLNEARADIRQGVDSALREQELQLQQQLVAKTQHQIRLFRSQHTEQEVAAIRKEIEQIKKQYQEVEYQIRNKNPRYAALTQPQLLTLKEIQQQVVDTNTILLAYWLGEERSYLWAITPTTINTYVLPKQAEIETAANQVYNFLINPSMMRTTPKKAAAATAALSQMVLGPVAGELGQKRLIIVGDGTLQYIPFSVLSLPQASPTNEVKPLLVEHEIVNLPSASTLALIRRDTAERQPAPKAVAVLADPVFSQDDPRVKGHAQVAAPTTSSQLRQMTRGLDEGSVVSLFGRLPGTEREANQILALVAESDRFQALDFDASRETATSPQLSQYRVLHFATHGFFNTLHPELSGIVLSLVDRQGEPQNGLLMTPDIFNLNLPAELIVLSGCQTGLGKEIRGEGLVGLTRGLMYAGASRVMVSLWSVRDDSTAELMTRFYQKMLQEKLPPAAALRAAQISMWQEKSEPHSWAGFILQGEWK